MDTVEPNYILVTNVINLILISAELPFFYQNYVDSIFEPFAYYF